MTSCMLCCVVYMLACLEWVVFIAASYLPCILRCVWVLARAFTSAFVDSRRRLLARFVALGLVLLGYSAYQGSCLCVLLVALSAFKVVLGGFGLLAPCAYRF